MAKSKIYPLPISRQIDTNFRNYALYVLENRGIPSFYDGLTNVQRIIMLNAPHSFNKSLSLVGSCITDGYHHGDKSLTGAINKLARPFGNSEQLLLGDGFFGSPINHEASAARYTSVRVSRYKGLDKTWLIEGVSEINPTAKTIRITELPPLMKYGSFLKRIENLIANHSIKLTNNSQVNIDILLQFTGTKEEWPVFVEAVEKSIKMIVTETPVFVKDGMVLEYNRIEDYIDDYRYRISELRVKRLAYFKQENVDELQFSIQKEKYLLFMLEGKKSQMITDDQIEAFLKTLTKGYPNIRRRLESIYLKSLTEQELERTRAKIKELTEELKKQEIELNEAITVLAGMTDTSLKRGTTNRSSSSANLFIDEEEIDGIAVFGNSQSEDEEESDKYE